MPSSQIPAVSSHTKAVPGRDRQPIVRKALWALSALALLIVTVVHVRAHGGGWLALGFALMPDLGLLAGFQQRLEKGQLAPRAVPLYNALHRPIGPLALGGLAISGVLSSIWLSAALGWALHIAIDRTVGYGLRGSDGFQRA